MITCNYPTPPYRGYLTEDTLLFTLGSNSLYIRTLAKGTYSTGVLGKGLQVRNAEWNLAGRYSALSRRDFLRLSGAGLAGTALLGVTGCGGAQESAADYPSEEVTMIVAQPAGSSTDIQGRAIAQYFEEELGQTVVVENVAGASGAVGTTEVVSSEPDGYTIGMSTVSSLAQPALTEGVGYQRDDFETVGGISEQAAILAVREDSEYETAEQFFEAAEENPGQVRVSQGGSTTPQGVELERLNDIYGIEVTSVPFDGASESVNALLGGDVEAVLTAGDPIISQIEGGSLRAIAVGSEERAPYLPDTPTFVELGYEDLTLSSSTFGLIVPAGTPPEIIETLEATLEGALENQETREQIDERYIPEDFIGAEDYADLTDETYEAYEQVDND